MREINCREIVAFLAPYHDRELDPLTRTIVEAHLAGCEQCRRELAALQAVDRLVATWAIATAPAIDPVKLAGVARELAGAALVIHGDPAADDRAATITARLGQVAKAAGRQAVRLTGASARGTVRIGTAVISGTRRAASSLTLGRQKAARMADGIAATTTWVRRITTATTRRFARGVPALG